MNKSTELLILFLEKHNIIYEKEMLSYKYYSIVVSIDGYDSYHSTNLTYTKFTAFDSSTEIINSICEYYKIYRKELLIYPSKNIFGKIKWKEFK